MTTVLDREAIKQKYAAERAKRLRPEGNEQYQRLAGKFQDMAADPHTPLSCPRLSGPSTMIVWIMKGTTNAEQEAQAGRDYWQAA